LFDNTARAQTLHDLFKRGITLGDSGARNVSPKVTGKLDEKMAVEDGEAADGTPRSEALNSSFNGLVKPLLVQTQADVLTRTPTTGLPC
jgi:hypothetical protein